MPHQCTVIPTPLPISEHPAPASAPKSAPKNPYNASKNFFQFIIFTFLNFVLKTAAHPRFVPIEWIRMRSGWRH